MPEVSSVFFEEFGIYLKICFSFVDLLGNFAFQLIGSAAGVNVATFLDVEHSGASVAAYSTGAVGGGQEPIDAVLFGFKATDVGGQV